MNDPERIWLQNADDARATGDRLWCQDKVWPECEEQQEPTEYIRADLYASRISQQDAEIERLRRELEEARAVIAWANNSLFGSHGFFLSLDGGEPDKHHLDRAIEHLKERARNSEAKLAEARKAAFSEAAEIADERAKYWRERVPVDTMAMTKEEMREIFKEKSIALETVVRSLRDKSEEETR